MKFKVKFTEQDCTFKTNFGVIQSADAGGYDKGYQNGYENGYAIGYNIGLVDGEKAGYQQGYTKGESEGYDKGYNVGLVDGEQTGYDKGFADGKADGYIDGYNAGKADGYVEGETAGYTNGYTEGQDSVPNPLEYATTLQTLFRDAVFPQDYELSINTPFASSLTGLLWNTTGLKKLMLKGNTKGQVVGCNTMCLGSANLETVDLREYIAKIGSMVSTFGNAKLLKEILGELDLSECTTITNPFSGCTSLEKVSFKAETISLSISFSQCSNLSAQSVQSIIDGLADLKEQTAQTITFHKTISSALTEEQMIQILEKNWSVE